jgi:hypothetical protein
LGVSFVSGKNLSQLEEKLLKFITLNPCWKETGKNCIFLLCIFITRNNARAFLYNYIEEIHFQSLTNSLIFEAIHIGFRYSLSLMVMPSSSKPSDEFEPPPQQGMLATTSHPDDSTVHPSHYATTGK